MARPSHVQLDQIQHKWYIDDSTRPCLMLGAVRCSGRVRAKAPNWHTRRSYVVGRQHGSVGVIRGTKASDSVFFLLYTKKK
jgi:hypothetical protein